MLSICFRIRARAENVCLTIVIDFAPLPTWAAKEFRFLMSCGLQVAQLWRAASDAPASTHHKPGKARPVLVEKKQSVVGAEAPHVVAALRTLGRAALSVLETRCGSDDATSPSLLVFALDQLQVCVVLTWRRTPKETIQHCEQLCRCQLAFGLGSQQLRGENSVRTPPFSHLIPWL